MSQILREEATLDPAGSDGVISQTFRSDNQQTSETAREKQRMPELQSLYNIPVQLLLPSIL